MKTVVTTAVSYSRVPINLFGSKRDQLYPKYLNFEIMNDQSINTFTKDIILFGREVAGRKVVWARID